MKKTRIRALEGRTITSAMIFHGDEDGGPSLELHVSGKKYFTFTAGVIVDTVAHTCLADDGTKGLEAVYRRDFHRKKIVDPMESAED